MGAYSNPQILVDTQSGQHLRNLQESLAGSVAKFGQTYMSVQEQKRKELEENGKKNQEVEKEVEKGQIRLMNGVNKLKGVNPKINLANTFNPLIERAKELNISILQNKITGVERNEAQMELSEINSTVDNDFSAGLVIAGEMVADLEEAALKGVGVEGGLAKELDPALNRGLRIFSGKIDGSVEAVYEDVKTKKLAYITKDLEGKEVYRFYADELKKMNAQNIIGVKILPDTTANTEAVKKQVSNVFENKLVDPKDPSKGTIATANINIDYLVRDKKTSKIEYEREPYGDLPGQYKLVAKVDKEAILPEVRTQLIGQLAAFDDSTLSSYYNNIIVPFWERATKETKELMPDNQVLTEEERDKAEEEYIKYWVEAKVPSQQIIQKEDPSTLILKVPKKKEGKTTKTSASDKKAADEEKELKQGLKQANAGNKTEIRFKDRKAVFDGKKWNVIGGALDGENLPNAEAAEAYIRTGSIPAK